MARTVLTDWRLPTPAVGDEGRNEVQRALTSDRQCFRQRGCLRGTIHHASALEFDQEEGCGHDSNRSQDQYCVQHDPYPVLPRQRYHAHELVTVRLNLYLISPSGESAVWHRPNVQAMRVRLFTIIIPPVTNREGLEIIARNDFIPLSEVQKRTCWCLHRPLKSRQHSRMHRCRRRSPARPTRLTPLDGCISPTSATSSLSARA